MRTKVWLNVVLFLGGWLALAASCKAAPPPKEPLKAPPIAPAKAANHALWFDGLNDFLRTDKWLSGVGTSFCIEAWVRPATLNPYSSLGAFLTHRAVGCDKRVRFDVEKNAFSFAAIQPPNVDLWITSGRKVTTGGWHHVAAVYDGRDLLLYVDGEVAAQTSKTVALDWDAAYQGSFIGGDPLPSAMVLGKFRGLLDEVRIWNTVRTKAEIRTTMNASLPANTPGLAAYWNFDEGGGQTARDVTGHGHDAQFGSTPHSGDDDPVWVRSDCPMGELASVGPAGHSLWFSGQGTRVLTGPLEGLREAKSLTLEAWIRPSALLSSGTLFASVASQPNSASAFQIGEGGKLSAPIWKADGGMSSFGTRPAIQPGLWQHVAFVYEQSGVRVLVNGDCIANSSANEAGAPILRGDPMVLGASNEPSPPMVSGSFAGEMDEVRIWSVARSDQEIRNAMNRAIARNEPGLVASWRFDEGDGEVARDLSSLAAHAQLGDNAMPDMYDPIWMVSDAPIVASAGAETTRPLRQNFALLFDGANDYADMGNAPELRMAGPLTVEAWIKPTIIVQSFQPVLGKGNANGRQNAYELLLDGTHARFQVSDGSAGCCGAQGWFPATGKSVLQAGIWHHLAGVYDRKNVIIYLDGIQEGTQALDRVIPDVTFSVKVGMNAFSQSKFFAGVIDEVRVWNRVRSQTEIYTDMNRSLKGNEPGLVAYWTFDEPGEDAGSSATCQITFDRSRYQHHGFLGGSLAREESDPRWVISDAPVAPWP